jgi:hypothetical protein
MRALSARVLSSSPQRFVNACRRVRARSTLPDSSEDSIGPRASAHALARWRLRVHALDASFSSRCRRSSCCGVARLLRSAISSACACLPWQACASAMAPSMRLSIFFADGLAHSHTPHSTASATIHQRRRIGWRPAGAGAGGGVGCGDHGMPRPRSGGGAVLASTGRPPWPKAVADGVGCGFGGGGTSCTVSGASDQPDNPATASAPAVAAAAVVTLSAATRRTRPSSCGGGGAPACWAVPQYGQYCTRRGMPRAQAVLMQR